MLRSSGVYLGHSDRMEAGCLWNSLTLHNGVITCDWIDDISSGHVTPATQSEAFVTKLVKDDRLNMIVGHFLVACQGAGLENLADRIKERINPNELNAYGY